jgi:predicted xylose isomerase-like sugar epimerase
MRYEEFFQRDWRLIWNADETQLHAMKRFKVICDQSHLPLVTAFEHVPHLTGMVSISGGRVVLAPIIILKNLQYLRELANNGTYCFFATSTNGWITRISGCTIR